MKSEKPFFETLEQLREIGNLSLRELHRRASDHGFQYTFSHFMRLVKGESPMDSKTIESIAAALQVYPETFAEYRLWRARHPYEPTEVGWDAAMKNLRLLEGGAARPHDPAVVAQTLRGRGGRGGRAASS